MPPDVPPDPPPDLALDLRARAGGFTLDVRLVVERGPLVLVGPNGAGKTTLLRVLAGALTPSDGSVRVRGRELVGGGRCLPPEARRVGYLPQGYGLFEHMSVADNVAYGLRELPRPEGAARARELLASLGVAHLGPRRPRGLSGGERQRVALARALAREPELLLLDEPTAALDVAARPAVRALLAHQLRDPRRAAVVVTHDLRDLLAWDPTIALLEGGRVVAQGTVTALRRGVVHPFLAELLSPLGVST